MTVDEVMALVQTVEFQPGWTVRAMRGEWNPAIPGWTLRPGGDEPRPATRDEVTIEAAVEVLDVESRHKIIRVSFKRVWSAAVLETMDEEQAIARLWAMLMEAVEHEAAEWYRVRGVKVQSPHAVKGQR